MAVDTNRENRENIYKEHVQELGGIKFTFREIDIIACILHNRGEKKIAFLLTISSRTVNSHIRNIMDKLGCGSRDSIIDFIEKSGKLQYFRNYYFQLVLQNTFEKQLQKIAAVINRSGIICSANFSNVSKVGGSLLQRIKHHLSLANITLVDGKVKSKNILYHLCTIGNELTSKSDRNNSIYILLESQADITLVNQLEYIDFTSKPDYYLSLLLLLKKIVANSELDTFIEKFREEQNALRNSLEGKSVHIVELTKQSKVSSKRHKFVPIILLLSVAMFSSFLFWIFVQKQSVQPVSETAINPTIADKTMEWNLPPLIEHYTQRQEITSAIWEKLKQNGNNQAARKTAILAGLYGLGGIGKTTLAKNSIHYPQKHYSFKGWFSAETKELLQADYSEIGEKYHLFAKDTPIKQKIALVKEWLEKQSCILLVYDNVPDMNILQEYIPNRGDIIITSRNHNVSGAIEVDVMTEDEAIKLLDNLLPKSEKKAANYGQDLKTLAKTLGYLPLALSQAGAYIAENSLTIQDYLSLYATNKDKLLSDKTMPAMDQHQPVYITWNLSIQKLKQQKDGDKALEMLNFITCCYPEHIPNKLLTQYLYGKIDNESIIKLNELLTLLRKYSLIKALPNTISIHRLVHSWFGSKLSKEKKLAVLRKAVKSIKAIYKFDGITENIDFVKQLLPHSEKILEQLQPEANEVEYADLLPILGDIYYLLGEHDKSKKRFEQALGSTEKFYGRNSLEAANVLSRMGIAYGYIGKYEESKKLLERALKTQQKYHPIKNVKIINTLIRLGKVYIGLGKYEEAKKLLEKALTTAQKHYGLRSVEYTTSLTSLGKLYISLGNYNKSKELLEEALAIKRKHYGLEYTNIAYTLSGLGTTYLFLGKYQESLELLETALYLDQKYYGSNIFTADSLVALGVYYIVTGNYVKAKESLIASSNIITKLYESDNIFTIKTNINLGNVYRLLNNYQKSKELLEHSLACIEKLHNYNQITIAKTIGNLGLLYGQLGLPDKRKNYLERALIIFKENLPPDHKDINQTISYLKNESNNVHIGYPIMLFP